MYDFGTTAQHRASIFRRLGWLALAPLVILSIVGPGAAGVAASGAAPRTAALADLSAPACGIVPLDVEIILDNSGSMTTNNVGQNRALWAKNAISQLIDDLQANGGVGLAGSTTDRHRVGLTKYNGTTASVLSSLGARNASDTKALVPSSGSGNTPFKTGMATGAADLAARARTTDFGLTVRHVIIFLSDGRPNPDPGQRPSATEISNFKAPADEVFSIAIGSGGSSSSAVDLVLMQALAKPNDAAHYKNVVDANGLPGFFAAIFQTIACPTPSPHLAITKSVTETGFSKVGDVLNYTIVATNDGNVTLAAVTVADPSVSNLACSPLANGSPLAPGAALNCTATHTVTQADLDLGHYANTACVDDGAGGAAQACASKDVPGDQKPHLAITKSVTETGFSKVGDVLNYTIVATNDGNVTLAAVTVADPSVSNLACSPLANGSPLAPGAALNCTATHTVTQADLDLGHYANTACVDDGAGGAAQACASKDVPGDQKPHLAITKSVTETGFSKVGDVLNYTIVATNDGNVTLAAVTVADPSVSNLACSPLANGSPLAPGAALNCTATHTVTQADLDLGHYANTACVDDGAGGAAQACASKDVPGTQNPAIDLAKSAGPTTYSAVGDSITYTYTITNTGNVTLGPAQFTVTDDHIAGGAFNCGAATTTLAPSATVSCTASYAITAADLDAGHVTNVAVAHRGELASKEASATVTAVQGPRLDLVKTASPATYDHVGAAVSYSYVLTNTGNVTLVGPFSVTDNKVAVSCPARESLAHGEAITCTASHLITQADLDAGSVTNVATGHGFFGQAPVASNEDSETVTAVTSPALVLVKGVSLTNGSGYEDSLAATVNQVVYYRLVVTNTGNVTLTGITLADSLADLAAKGCEVPTTLAPNAMFACDYSARAQVGTTANTATADSAQTEPSSDTATVTVGAPTLTVSKSVTGNTDGTEPLIPDDDGGPAPRAKIGDTLTFTLAFTLARGPLANVVITDVLPVGYGAPTAISDGGTYDAATRTITWGWESVAESGSVTYKVVVLAGANELSQPLRNVATIDSADTEPSGDVQPVVIAGAAKELTPPPTDTQSTPVGNASGNILPVLLAILGLVVVLGVLTPAPTRIRRRTRRG